MKLLLLILLVEILGIKTIRIDTNFNDYYCVDIIEYPTKQGTYTLFKYCRRYG